MKKIYLLPSFLTLCNLLCGYWSITFSLKGYYAQAALMIYFSLLFDAFDGRIARWTHTTSKFGKEFDSLADVISFGIAPACMIYHMFGDGFGVEKMAWWGCFIYVVCGALRLARYNVQATKEEKQDFTGLPIPCAAGMISAYVLFNLKYNYEIPAYSAIFLMIPLGFLMISSVRYSSLKINLRNRKTLEYFVAGVLLIGLMVRFPYHLLLFTFLGYILFGFIMAIKNKTLGKSFVFLEKEEISK